MTAPPRTGARAALLLVLVAVPVLVVVAALGWIGVRLAGSALRPDPEVRAELTVTLAPDGDDTRVQVELRAVSGAFPDRVRVTLPAQDDGVTTDRTPFTGTTLRYLDLVDGAGAPLRTDGAVNPQLQLTGGGDRLLLGYRVAAAAGRRVLLPVPGVAGVRVTALTVRGSGALDPAGLRCWQGGGSDNGQLAYHPCTLDAGGRISLDGGSQLRLEPA